MLFDLSCVFDKYTGLIEDDILRNAASSVRSIIKPWSDYVCRHEYGSVRVCEKPTYIVTPWFDNGTYGGSRISKNIIFDESFVFDKYIDNSP